MVVRIGMNWHTSTRARAFAMAACWRTCCITSVFASILEEVCGCLGFWVRGWLWVGTLRYGRVAIGRYVL
jgi:hypothetical protein